MSAREFLAAIRRGVMDALPLIALFYMSMFFIGVWHPAFVVRRTGTAQVDTVSVRYFVKGSWGHQ